MNISIIIPTLNAAGLLPSLFAHLSRQSLSSSEIIIIDSSSEDNTVEVARSYGARLISIEKKNFDHGRTRNLAASNATGDILVYLTQDVIPADSLALEYVIHPFKLNGKIAAVYGRQLPNVNASPFSAHLRLFNYPDTSYVRRLEDRGVYGIKTVFFSNSFSAYRRSALEEIGWFEKDLIFGEDTHAVARLLMAGYNVAYAADALVYHSHNYTVSQEFKRYFDIGVFHGTENWLVKEFGKTQGEGKRYTISEASFLIRHKKFALLPVFLLRNFVKFLGYSLGLRYTIIPRGLACRISMNKNWWREAGREHE